MHERNKFHYVALGLILGLGIAIVFLLWAVPEFRDPSYAQEYYYSQSNQNAGNGSNFYQRWVTPFFSAEDTLAQWVMAFFTVVMAVTATLGAWWVRGTLVETRNAVQSANDAVAVSRDIGEAQTRAYLAVEGGRFTQEDRFLSFYITIKNIGQTPALDVDIKANMTLHHTEFDNGNPITATATKGGFVALESGVSDDAWLIFSPVNLSGEILDYFAERNARFWLDCDISWLDIFGKKHCFFIMCYEDRSDEGTLTGSDELRKGKLSTSVHVNSAVYEARTRNRKNNKTQKE